MEDRLWDIVCDLLPQGKPNSRQRYSEREILLVVLWAVLHDRPMVWACQAAHWPERRRLAHLPHPSTLSRRARRPALVRLLETAHDQLRTWLGCATPTVLIDGKPLLVSDYSRDPDARDGRAMRRFRRGYKLHAVIDTAGVVQQFGVVALNVQERTMARQLLPQTPTTVRRVLADGNYDSGTLHRLLALRGSKLYTPLINNYAGPRSHPRRRRLARLLQLPIGQRLMNAREHIERQFGLMGNLGFGLKGLPNWVRRLHRVQRWVSCKLLLFHAWKLTQAAAA